MDTEQGGGQGIDIGTGVIGSERSANGAFETEAAMDRLGAMMAGADGDAFAIEKVAEFLGADTVEDEGEHAGLLRFGITRAAVIEKRELGRDAGSDYAGGTGNVRRGWLRSAGNGRRRGNRANRSGRNCSASRGRLRGGDGREELIGHVRQNRRIGQPGRYAV